MLIFIQGLKIITKMISLKVKFFIDVNGILSMTAYELSPKGEELKYAKTEIEY